MYPKTSILSGLIASLAAGVTAGGDVFAHHIIGTSAWMNQQDWSEQIALASAAGIDGFALNIAKDSYTDTQLGYAYDAAAQHGSFKMFISFDYEAAKSQGGFSPSDVQQKIDAYKSKPAQYMYNGKQPLVSTFEGPESASSWAGIKAATGAFFMPDWSSLGPQGAAGQSVVDGLLSWDAWPTGATDVPNSAMTYKQALGSKPFMMPVSPWFYTNIPNSKNWLWSSDSLWFKSWEQAIMLQPAMIEILTWNDWGESSYVAPNPRDPSAFPPGVQSYVQPSNHSAWLADLPYYIGAYKNGGAAPANYKPHVTFSYRLSPGAACASTGTKCNAPYQGSQPAAGDCDKDEIAFTAFGAPGQSASVTVAVGGASKTLQAPNAGVWSSSVPFSDLGGAIGAVTVSGDGLGSATGDPISNNCVAGWNAFVGTTG